MKSLRFITPLIYFSAKSLILGKKVWVCVLSTAGRAIKLYNLGIFGKLLQTSVVERANVGSTPAASPFFRPSFSVRPLILRFVRTWSDSRPEIYILAKQGVTRNRFFSGCVKSTPGVAIGLVFRINCAPHKKETESTHVSHHGQKDRPVTSGMLIVVNSNPD